MSAGKPTQYGNPWKVLHLGWQWPFWLDYTGTNGLAYFAFFSLTKKEKFYRTDCRFFAAQVMNQNLQLCRAKNSFNFSEKKIEKNKNNFCSFKTAIFESSGLYNKHTTIVNDDSSFINKGHLMLLESSITPTTFACLNWLFFNPVASVINILRS
jgi:hypothetical protein